MNAKDSYELHIEARKARAAAQGALLARLAEYIIKRARRGWSGLWETCRRRLRARDIAEA